MDLGLNNTLEIVDVGPQFAVNSIKKRLKFILLGMERDCTWWLKKFIRQNFLAKPGFAQARRQLAKAL